MSDRICLQCSEPRPEGRKKFCSQKCAMKWHNSRQDWFDRADRELHNARKKARYRDDPEVAAEKMRQWRIKHPEQQKQYEQKYRKIHPEILKARNQRWRAENPEYSRAYSHVYHAAHRATQNEGRIERTRQAKEISPWMHCLRARANKAQQKKLPFELSDEWARARWTGRCELTEIPFNTSSAYGNFFSPSIDRIDASKGYVQDNCRFILFAVNALKGTGTDEDMLRVVSALYARHVHEDPLKL